MNVSYHVGVDGLRWMNDCFILFPLASDEYQPKPEVNLLNNMAEKGQTKVKER